MRNIVLITFDSLRADHCSFMGYRRETTPNMDAMANSGLYFVNAVAHNIATAPSMFGIFTGSQPLCQSNDMNPRTWRKEIRRSKTLAEELGKLGYKTAAFHPNPWVSSYYGFDKGFRFYKDFVRQEDRDAVSRGRPFISRVKDYLLSRGFSFPWEDMYGEIRNWTKNSDNKPYFLWILSLDTHFLYTVPRKAKKWGRSNLYINYLHWKLPRWGLSMKEKERLIDAYDDGIRYADSLLKRLEDDLQGDNPVFIIHADHGEEFWEHGHFGHGNVKRGNPLTLYEELIHVPLVIYNVGINSVVDKPVLLSDLYTAILQIAKTGNLDLDNLGDEFVVSKVSDKNQVRFCVRSRNWKFITGPDQQELYDLKADPREHQDLSSKRNKVMENMQRVLANNVMTTSKKKEMRKIQDRTAELRKR